jgi:hypothetical protein
MFIWRVLVQGNAQQRPQSGNVSLDSTLFERNQASQYYRQRSGQNVKTVKATALTDTGSLVAVGVHCCIEREHDTKRARGSWPPTAIY